MLRVMEDDELEEHVGLDGLMVKKLRKKMVRACLTICFFVGARSRRSLQTPPRMRVGERNSIRNDNET